MYALGCMHRVPALGLCGGAALHLFAHIAFLWRTTGRVFRRLGLVSAVCSLVVAYEVIRYRAARIHVRHPELAA
jgi:hypothetical protein